MENNKVEQILLKFTSFTPAQAKHLLRSKDRQGQRLVDCLGKNKTANQTLLAVCQRLGVSFLPEIPFSEIPSELVTGLPIQYVKSHNILPFKETGKSVQVLTSNPLDFEAFDSLKVKFNKTIEPVMSFNYKIQEAINRVYEKNTHDFDEFEDIQAEEYNLQDPVIDLLEAHDEAPIIKLVNTILVRAVKERASDIHLEPYENEFLVRFRVDGNSYSVLKLKKRLQSTISSELRLWGN